MRPRGKIPRSSGSIGERSGSAIAILLRVLIVALLGAIAAIFGSRALAQSPEPSASATSTTFTPQSTSNSAASSVASRAAIVGVDGDIEHAAALLHPRMGKPMRDAIGGGQAIIPSNAKIGAAGVSIDVPLGHKDDVWSFNEIDTLTVTVGGAPRPKELVLIVVLSDGGRPRPRVAKSGSVPAPQPRKR